jgi:hypothetical protein
VEMPMARVPITVMGFRCERCAHEWLSRGRRGEDPRTCPRCKSAYWDRPRMTYEAFKAKVVSSLSAAVKPLSWAEIQAAAESASRFRPSGLAV